MPPHLLCEGVGRRLVGQPDQHSGLDALHSLQQGGAGRRVLQEWEGLDPNLVGANGFVQRKVAHVQRIII